MHASIEQLLVLRDAPGPAGPVDAAVARHVRECADCCDEIARLKALREEMRSLPVQVPLTDPWAVIRQRAAAGVGRPGWSARLATAWPLGLAASLLVAALVSLMWPASQPATPGQTELAQPITTAATRDLVAESQRLEKQLRSVGYQPRVVNAGTADTIAQLEDRIALLDYGLSLGAGRQLTADNADALWRQRVDLMNSLVQVRAAQAQRVDF